MLNSDRSLDLSIQLYVMNSGFTHIVIITVNYYRKVKQLVPNEAPNSTFVGKTGIIINKY